MNNITPPIVIIAFNRPKSLKRLLKSLSTADYRNRESVTLIISIDKGNNNQDVLSLAQEFQWNFGEKKIIYQSENLGLRKHVINCASYCNEYGSVIILEDDLFVSPQFYNFTCQALEFSLNKDDIKGISLYNHQFNVNAKSNFLPIEDGYDNWYLQFASSWGQAWTSSQWNGFMDWYHQQSELKPSIEVPQNVTKWSSKSWLKYFIHYLVETNTYFLYPKISLTTNFSDAGTHINQGSTTYQVPLNYSKSKTYNFSDFAGSMACYDVYFENIKLSEALNIEKEMLCVDLYGTKNVLEINQRYILSSNIYNFKIVSSYGCYLKPKDVNIINGISGESLFLYDTTHPEKNSNRFNFYTNLMYDLKHIHRRDAKKLFLTMYFNRLRLFLKDRLGI